MRLFSFSLCLLLLCAANTIANDFKPDAAYYGVGFWHPDTLGNHRAVVEVDKDGNIAYASIPWRRRDKTPDEKGIIIIDAKTGEKIDNFYRLSITNEQGEIVFEPTSGAGKYYIYYLSYKTSGGPYPRINYLKESTVPNATWLENAKKTSTSQMQKASLVQFQSLSSFDGFYPMEIIATAKEKGELIEKNSSKPFILFPEDREHGIRMFNEIPYRWIVKGAQSEFNAEADMNEYFVFQLGLWAYKNDVKSVKVKFSPLKGADGKEIDSSWFTCFNTEGIDWLQRPMEIDLNVAKGAIQPLWIGMDMPSKGFKEGVYSGTVTVEAEGMEPQIIDINIDLSDNYLTDKGDGDVNRLSRLRWLNSTFACDNGIVKPFIPVSVSGKKIDILGRSVELDQYGLPSSIESYFTQEMTTIGSEPRQIITKPVSFVIRAKGKDIELKNSNFEQMPTSEGKASWKSENRAGDIDVDITGTMEFDGFMEYRVKVKANNNSTIDDIRLDVAMDKRVAKYWLGLGKEGSLRPKRGEWKWDVKNNQEGYWFGDVNAGIQCLLRDENYVRPLNTNFYHQKPLNLPPSWYNDGKGGIKYGESKEDFLISAFSGKRELKAGEELNFIFLVSITPFKTIDTKKQWSDRYIHSHLPIDEAMKDGANVINIHHAQTINPFINYPFLRPDYMKQYIDEAHSKGAKVKVYYTVRELANRAPELWALRSLGHEVFSGGDIPGYSWLGEHLGEDYIAAWFVDKYKDAAIVNSGVSRWHNYYVEGLQWLAANIDIDGIYIDDLAIDRTTMKRVRKVLERNRPEPRIDLHSANQFNKSDGFINSAFLYMEHMPYLDRIWFGEYFKYEKAPDYWMTEVAGIPFGMMGEMLQNDGNPWRGMLFGMTARYRYHGKTTPMYFWQLWDNFGIEDSRMMGYWVSYNPIKTDNKEVLATTFVKEGKVLIALASWANEETTTKLKIDWESLGIDKSKAKLYFPEMETLQSAKTISTDGAISIPKDGGAIIILQ